MILADYHMHTSFSSDSKADPAAQANAAIAAGLSRICITDHDDPGYPGHEFDLDIPSYYQAIGRLSRAFEGRLKILTGIELGLRTDEADAIRSRAAAMPWDFIIGSTHVVDGNDPYYSSYWNCQSVHDAILRYYEATLANIHAFDCFDVYGHIDYITRYIPQDRLPEYHKEDFCGITDEILHELIARGKGIECNTAGFRHRTGEPNPNRDILSRYLQLGGTILTIGSDGHCPEHVALGFDRLASLLRACGISSYTVFEQRKAMQLPV